jgi:DNA topoisomerase-3
MKLYICEKPSVAKSVATSLGIPLTASQGAYSSGNVAVTWCIGHLLEQFRMEDYDKNLVRWDLAPLPYIPTEWKMKIKENTKSQYFAVKALLARASKVVLATDFDREGEVIGRSILELCDYTGPVARIKLTSFDEITLASALQNETDGDINLPIYYAGLGRQRADWLVGLNFTRFYTLHARNKGLEGLWPVGRVQSATLNLIVKRDREIENFVSCKFFENHVTLKVETGTNFTAKWLPPAELLTDDKLLLNKDIAAQVATELTGQTAMAKNVISQATTESAPLPLDLSSAQMIANDRWGYTAQQTLNGLQALYESHKLTTYPRTDCRYLKSEMRAEITDTIAAIRQTDDEIADVLDTLDLSLESKAWNSEKITAHHAITPTRQAGNLAKLDAIERNLYTLVRDHYIAQFLPICQMTKTTVEFDCNGHRLVSKGTVVIDLGWKRFMTTVDEDELQALPEITKGEGYPVVDVKTHEGKTKPPKHYTDSTLLGAMKNAASHVDDPELKKRLKELSGIGTEATRADVIERLHARGLYEKKGKQLISSAKGRALIDMISDDLKDIGLTALWEQQLDDIAARKAKLGTFMDDLSSTVKKIFEENSAPTISTEGLVFKCPKCDGELKHLIKQGKGGFNFWACKDRENCNSTYDNKGNKPNFEPKGGVVKKKVVRKK